MKFYDREKELDLLNQIENKAAQNAQMTFVIGRRRIGKTALLTKAYKDKTLYFFVTKKNEALLCEEYISEIKNKLNITVYGEFKNFKSLFSYLMDLSKSQKFTLIIDEFQEFLSINPSIYGDMQYIWDLNKDNSSINLILCGSIYSLMNKIFENSKEPLFGRATAKLNLHPFSTATIKEIIKDYKRSYDNEDLLAMYMFSGGIAKYIESFVQAKAFTNMDIINEIFSTNSLFLDEGKNVLIDEFGKDYSNYFSILTLIASSKTSRNEMESIMQIELGGFLDKLEKDFALISKVRPIFAKPSSRSVKYKIIDNFLNFWFRFIYKNRGAVEMRNYKLVKDILKRDYQTYSGIILEKYFIQKLSEE
ncbi:MAG: ATP-binding protein, partial [Elusimicrobiota bacterium]|nr:ATP-binding protein [Elusimicrobiota bacterium]